MVILGGRVAEEIFFHNKISTGASQDLEQCKSLIISMILKHGMGGKIILSDYSEKNNEVIDKEITKLLDEAYNKARMILLNSKDLLYDCAQQLMVTNILSSDDITKIINNKYKFIKKLFLMEDY
jgi:cell division protease FtsH